MPLVRSVHAAFHRSIGLTMAAGLGFVVSCQKHDPEPAGTAASSASATASAAPSSRPAELPTSAPEGSAAAASASATPMPDGTPAPDLPDSAPDTVGFGVILVTYKGAESAPSDARTKEAALLRAKELATEALKDFAAAVKKGDRGSIEDAGTMPRGVLDRAAEYALFTLKKGDVYGQPLDTARGYWVVRRLR